MTKGLVKQLDTRGILDRPIGIRLFPNDARLEHRCRSCSSQCNQGRSTSHNTLGVTRRPLRGLATQPMKRVAWEGRGNPCADLAVSSGTS